MLTSLFRFFVIFWKEKSELCNNFFDTIWKLQSKIVMELFCNWIRSFGYCRRSDFITQNCIGMIYMYEETCWKVQWGVLCKAALSLPIPHTSERPPNKRNANFHPAKEIPRQFSRLTQFEAHELHSKIDSENSPNYPSWKNNWITNRFTAPIHISEN